MAKKQCNFRLSAEAVLAIKIKAKERQCSEADVIEGWALGASYNGITPGFEPDKVGSTPTAPAIQKDEKRAMFDDLKAKLAAGVKIGFERPAEPRREPDLQNVPHGSFDVNMEGEPHRVAQLGKAGMWLFYLSEEGNKPIRKLAEGELERLWAKRIIK